MLKQTFEIKGMMRDLDPAKLNSNYAYEIRNLRLTAQEDSTMLSLVSEKGNAKYNIINNSGDPFTIEGDIIGYCTLHDYIVLFTHINIAEPEEPEELSVPHDPEEPQRSAPIDKIYRLEMNGMNMIAVELYHGNLGFGDDGVDIESIGVYENKDIQKVYWIDGVHQPRYINIVEKDTSKWNDNSFDFVPLISRDEDVVIEKTTFNGMFNAGTIQYFLTYYNRNGRQSAVFYQSPLNYISHADRGASVEDTVNNSFNIRIYNPDENFDYIRVYSVFRSAENGVPVCKKVRDIKISNPSEETRTYIRFTNIVLNTETSTGDIQISLDDNDVYIIDSDNKEIDIENFLEYRNGLQSFYTIDSNYSIFVVSRHNDPITILKAPENESARILKDTNAFEVKKTGTNNLRKWDNVDAVVANYNTTYKYVECIDNGISNEVVDSGEILFAGGANIIPSTMAAKDNTLFFGNYKSTKKISEEDKDIIKNNNYIYFGYSNNVVDKGEIGNFYMYHNQFDKDAKRITTFKGGETYHFGIILQNSNGIWTDVIPLGNAVNEYYPNDYDGGGTYFVPVKAYVYFNNTALSVINNYIAIKIVMLETLPTVVAQGVLCPTVFNKYRNINSPYCMSSWFFRDIKPGDNIDLTPHHIQNLHNGNIVDGFRIGTFDGEMHYESSDSIECIGELQGVWHNQIGYYDFDVDHNEHNDTDMYVDWNTLTLNSPDIEFGQIPNNNYKMRIVGITPITSCITSLFLTWDSSIPYLDGMFEYDPIICNNISSDAYSVELNNFLIKTIETVIEDENEVDIHYGYPVYPWHRNTSIIAQQASDNNDEDDIYGLLGTKIMASLRESSSTRYSKEDLSEKLSYNITKMKIYNDDDSLLLLDEDKYNPLYHDKKVYAGSRDVVLLNTQQYATFRKNIDNNEIAEVKTDNSDPVRMQYRSTTHGVFSLESIRDTLGKKHMYILPNVGIGGDVLVDTTSVENINKINYHFYGIIKHVITVSENTTLNPIWPKTIALEEDDLLLEIPSQTHGDLGDLSFTLVITNFTYNGTFKKFDLVRLNGSDYDDYVFYVLAYNGGSNMLRVTTLNNDYYYAAAPKHISHTEENLSNEDIVDCSSNPIYVNNGNIAITQYTKQTSDVFFKFIDGNILKIYKAQLYYMSISFRYNNNNIQVKYREIGTLTQLYQFNINDIDENKYILQDEYNVNLINISENGTDCSYMYIAELYSENNTTPNYENASWVVASEPVKTGKQCVEASIGDTYYQRYDCLKTYPQSLENQNSIVEIFSFMCETKINIDGRYDNRRGLPDNTAIIGSNFNNINKAYTQTDNIFAYHYLDPDNIYVNDFPNQIIYTMTKVFGSDIDSWTQVVATSTLDMDGSLGKIRSLKLWNDNLLCFQDMGIAKIMYNERTALSTEQGVPIEIANSNKLEGKKYITNQIGCSNKNSIQATQNGLYFIDGNTKDIYAWRDNLKSLSKDKGFNTYMQKDIDCINNEKTFYDPQLQDLYFRFTDDDKTECLVFNEQLNEFTSFFDYDVDIMFPFKDSLISVKNNDNSLWKQFAGEYLRYFDEEEDGYPVYKDYIIQLISAEHPTITKTFTNVEFRADVLNGSITEPETQAFSLLQGMNICPFNTLKVWNEYQNTGDDELTKLLRKGSNMSQKFRIWRADIGRDKAKGSRIFSRITSPWARIKLVGGKYNMKSVIHDIAVCYV